MAYIKQRYDIPESLSRHKYVNMACNCFDGHLALGICRNRSADLEVGAQNTNNANIYS